MDEVSVRALAQGSAKARTMVRGYFIVVVLELVMGNDLLCKDECRTSHDDDILACGGSDGRMVPARSTEATSSHDMPTGQIV